MNEYRIEEISVGMKEGFSKTVTAEMMEKFYAITGDGNPLHRDPEFAKAGGFAGCVAYGMLTASFISTLGGCYLPGRHCVIQGVEARFARPVYIGDRLSIEGEVCKVDLDLKYVEIKVTMRNQHNDKVLRGVLKAGVSDER